MKTIERLMPWEDVPVPPGQTFTLTREEYDKLIGQSMREGYRDACVAMVEELALVGRVNRSAARLLLKRWGRIP